MLLNELFEVGANPDYLRAAERSRKDAQDTQRQYWKNPEEKTAARRTELKRDAGIAGYSKRHRAAHPEMYPKIKAQPAAKLRDPSTEYSDDYSTWAAGRRDTMEQGVAEGRVAQIAPGGADYSKHSTDELKAMLRPGVMGRNELKFKTLIRRELRKREQQGVAEVKKNDKNDDHEPFNYDEWKASTVKPRKPRGYKDAEALGKALDREQSELRKRKMKEEVELDEAFKVGIVKLKDNTSMVLKKEDADILNKLMSSMSAGSVKKMTETAMKDKNGFAEILAFAKEAV